MKFSGPPLKNDFVIKTMYSNSRIAKNTIFLYLRMLLSLVVSLYTSRVVLQVLGTQDYGLYSVVGGIVIMFGFLNSSMSGATSRFLTYEIGRSDEERLKDTFSSAMEVHLAIALMIFVVAETVGLWLLAYKLNIPEGRMGAAHVVYQTSVLSMMVGVTQVPYNASIIAHEKMDVYAYVEMLNILLKLVIVYVLLIGNLDKLILYAFLILGVSVFIAVIYRVYCIRKFKECHFHAVWRPKVIKPLLTFSGWDLYGNMSGTVQQQGINMIVNHFLGVIVNAACGIATVVNGAVLGFANNIVMAFRPQVIQSYAQGNIPLMSKLMTNASKYCLLLFLMISLPLIAEMPYVLHLWLTDVPDKTVQICRIVLLTNIPGLINSIIIIGIHATGKIKKLSFIGGSLYLFTLLPAYFILHFGSTLENVYWCIFLVMVIMFFSNGAILKHNIPEFPLSSFFIETFKNSIFITIAACFVFYFISKKCPSGFFQLGLSVCLSVLMFGSYTYLFVIEKEIRWKLNEKIKMSIRKWTL